MQDATDEFEDADYYQKMISAWRRGDIDAMEVLIVEDIMAYPRLYEALFTKRNKSWVRHIEAMVRQGGHYLVIAGAGHFIGPDNVIQMLNEKGYAVERLP